MLKYLEFYPDFWDDPVVSEEMNGEEKLFILYLLTNSKMTQNGTYQITKRHIAFDLNYPIEKVHSLIERFIEHYKLIHYNPEIRELSINEETMRSFVYVD